LAANAQRLFATWLNGGNSYQIRRQVVGRKRLDVHFNQANEWAAEIWFRSTAAIDNHPDCGNHASVRANDIDRLLHASAARDNVFNHDEFFVRRNLKAAAEDKFAVFFFDKDMRFA